jgi:hypothetical protein
MKKYEEIVKGSFEAYQIVRGVEVTDFTIHSSSNKPMNLTVWLDYEDNTEVEKIGLTLTEGTKWELTALVAKWLNSVDFDGIREGFARWKELDAEL